MPEEQIKGSVTPHDALLERARNRYPERNFSGQDGQEGQDDLEQAIMEMLEETDGRLAESNSKTERLIEIFKTDPQSAEFMSVWAETGDPRKALVRVFGDDLSGLATEEGRNKFSDDLTAWRSRREENDRLDAEAAANFDKSLADLDSWGDGKGLDTKQKADIMFRLVSIAANGLVNIYTPDDFELVYKEMTYDSAVSTARQEGEVAGRNERLAAQRKSRASYNEMPPAGSGQGLRSKEKAPDRKPEEKSVWSEIS